MGHAGNGTGFWRSVRELPDRTSLRAKLITAVLALVILALGVISFAGISYIRGYLLDRADSQLTALADRAGSSRLGGAQNIPGPPVGERAVTEFVTKSGQVHPLSVPGYYSYQPGSTGPAVPTSSSWLAANAGKAVTVPAQTGGDKWRVLVEPNQTAISANGPINGSVVVGLDVTDIYATVSRLEAFDLLVSLGIVVILAVAAAAAVRASLRPLNDIEETAGAIAAGDLTRRVPEGDPGTEVGRLGRSLNVMLSQIESAFRARTRSEAAARRSEERMRQFVADASHELRTPLTAIRGFAEYYRQRGGVTTGPGANGAVALPALGGADASGTGTDAGAVTSDIGAAGSSEQNGTGTRKGPLAGADMDRIMRRVEQESARMGVLVEDMLLLARMDQQRPLESGPVDLLTLAADAVHDARVVAPSRSINLTVDTSQAPIVIGDEVRLRQVIGNLMSNALNHTPDGTPIEVLIRSGSLGEALRATAMAQPAAPNPAHPAVVLDVADHGPGLSQDQAEHVFERFYRADAARTSGGGTGLGLAIVAALAVAHGGAAWVKSRPGEGATFSIALPLSPDAVQGDEEEDSDLDGPADDPYDLTDPSARPRLDSAPGTRGNIV
jgi:two-component system, OmpR family, sensor kinase